MKLIVGLGNPSSEYENTRHNVGFMLLDYIFDKENFVVNKKMNAMEYITNIGGEKVVVIKPTTYMNLSGDAVIKYINFYKLDVADVFVIQDDLDMPLGRIKLMSNRGDETCIVTYWLSSSTSAARSSFIQPTASTSIVSISM